MDSLDVASRTSAREKAEQLLKEALNLYQGVCDNYLDPKHDHDEQHHTPCPEGLARLKEALYTDPKGMQSAIRALKYARPQMSIGKLLRRKDFPDIRHTYPNISPWDLLDLYEHFTPVSELFDSWLEAHDESDARNVEMLRNFFQSFLNEMEQELALGFIEALHSAKPTEAVRALGLTANGPKGGSIEDLVRAYKHSPGLAEAIDTWYKDHSATDSEKKSTTTQRANFCRMCGAKVISHSRFCEQCGMKTVK